MPVASNTSPVLNLAIIAQLSLLHEQFGEIWIPPGVLDELRVEEDLPGSQAIREAIKAGWLHAKDVEDQVLVSVLQRDLDRGEAEAIALAVEDFYQRFRAGELGDSADFVEWSVFYEMWESVRDRLEVLDAEAA